MPTKNRGKATSAAIGPAGDGCLARVLHSDIAKARAPALKASSLSARAQKNLLCGCATTAGISIRSGTSFPTEPLPTVPGRGHFALFPRICSSYFPPDIRSPDTIHRGWPELRGTRPDVKRHPSRHHRGAQHCSNENKTDYATDGEETRLLGRQRSLV